MDIRQKQCLLCFLGYDTGGVDGIWGKKSVAATQAFQRHYGLTADGIFGADTEKKLRQIIGAGETEDWWEEIRYFRREEFACRCGRYCDGYPAPVQERLVRLADSVRAHFGCAVTVSSGLRCETHNRAVGGVADSRHRLGKAMDFRVAGHTADQVLAYVRTLPAVRYAYAIDGNYIHMDVQ